MVLLAVILTLCALRSIWCILRAAIARGSQTSCFKRATWCHIHGCDHGVKKCSKAACGRREQLQRACAALNSDSDSDFSGRDDDVQKQQRTRLRRQQPSTFTHSSSHPHADTIHLSTDNGIPRGAHQHLGEQSILRPERDFLPRWRENGERSGR